VGKDTTDIARRTEAYRKGQEIFKREVPFVPLAHATVFKAMSKKVVGYRISPFGIENFYHVNLE
jgi:dipeptide transport system substrate-binding protein